MTQHTHMTCAQCEPYLRHPVLNNEAQVRTAQGETYYHEIAPSDLYHKHAGDRQRWALSLLTEGDQLLKVRTEFHTP